MAILLLLGLYGTLYAQEENQRPPHAPLSIDELPPLTDYDKELSFAPDDSPAVVLFSGGYKWDSWTETRFTVVERVKILEDAGRQFGQIFFRLKPEDTLDAIEGRTLLPDGTVIEIDPDSAIQIRVDYKGIWGPELIYRIEMPALEPGAILEYSYTIATPLGSGFRFNFWFLQRLVYTYETRYTLDNPKSFMPFTARLENSDLYLDPIVERTENRRITSYRFPDIPALELEPLMPPPDYLLARLVVDYEWTRSETSDPDMFWLAYGLNRESMVRQFIEDNNGIPELVASLVQGKAEERQKIKAILDWVGSSIKNLAYIDIEWVSEVDELTYQAAEGAAEVLANGYGDPMEITLLSIAMLREAGVEAYLALAVSRREGVFRPEFLDVHQFTTAFVAIRLPNDHAYFICPAQIRTSAGSVPWDIQGIRALIGHPGGGWFARVSVDPAVANASHIAVRLELSPGGDSNGVLSWTMSGQAANEWRHRFVGIRPELIPTILQDEIRTRMPGTTVSNVGYSVSETDGHEVEFHADLSVADFATWNGDTLELHPGTLIDVFDISIFSEERKHPLFFQFPQELTISYEIVLPLGYRTRPQGNDVFQSTIGEFTLFHELVPPVYHWSMKLTQDKIFFRANEYHLLRNFIEFYEAKRGEPVIFFREK